MTLGIDDYPGQPGETVVIVTKGEVMHLPTGATDTKLKRGTAILFEAGEHWQLQTLSEVEYLEFEVVPGLSLRS